MTGEGRGESEGDGRVKREQREMGWGEVKRREVMQSKRCLGVQTGRGSKKHTVLSIGKSNGSPLPFPNTGLSDSPSNSCLHWSPTNSEQSKSPLLRAADPLHWKPDTLYCPPEDKGESQSTVQCPSFKEGVL